MPAHPGSGPAKVWAEIIGGDALGRGHDPALCWWLPEGSAVQRAYRLRTDDGFDTGRVDSGTQSFVRLPVFDRARRSAKAQVKVWTDLGESEWSDPVRLEAAGGRGLVGAVDRRREGSAAQQGIPAGLLAQDHHRRSAIRPGSAVHHRPGTVRGVPRRAAGRRRRTRTRLHPVPRARSVSGLRRHVARAAGRHVLAVLLADGWYRGQVGLPRAADQYGDDVAVRVQFEVQTEQGWQVAAASHSGWRVAPSHITAADLIGGQREDRRLLDPTVHDPAVDDTAFDDRSWNRAVARDVDVAVVRSVAPPVRRVL